MSSSEATSSAFHRSTSRRIRTARCRGGRCCSAATKASRIDSFATARSAGSPSSARTWRSSTGSTHAVRGTARRERGLDRLPRRAGEVHRQRAPRPAGQLVEADVGGDAVQPRAQRRPALEVARAPARRGPSSPAPRRRRRRTSRACGSSSRSAPGGARAAAGRAARAVRSPRWSRRPLLWSMSRVSTPQDADNPGGPRARPLLVADQLRLRAHLGDRLLRGEHRAGPRRRSSSSPRTAAPARSAAAPARSPACRAGRPDRRRAPSRASSSREVSSRSRPGSIAEPELVQDQQLLRQRLLPREVGQPGDHPLTSSIPTAPICCRCTSPGPSRHSGSRASPTCGSSSSERYRSAWVTEVGPARLQVEDDVDARLPRRLDPRAQHLRIGLGRSSRRPDRLPTTRRSR